MMLKNAMKERPLRRPIVKVKASAGIFLLAPILVLFSGCGEMNPQNVDVQLEKSAPVEKVTSYTQALMDMGLMSEIYDTGLMKVQSQDIADQTGSSAATGFEIQRNITEIMKSTLNSIGGNIIFIDYDPQYVAAQMQTNYSTFDNKAIPDVVITGGITEFDRGLETRGSGTNADIEGTSAIPDFFASDAIGLSYGDSSKQGKARITLDFNLKDFQTLAGISRMTTTNSMEVYKGLKESEVGITLFGPTFGLKGTIKKVQGRHEAVRLLVQVSMIQMIGKYLALPYWRLLGEDTNPDKVVLDSISATYYRMAATDRIGAVQQWLILHGYDVDLTGDLDAKTVAALQQIEPTYTPNVAGIGEELFTKVYLTIPINRKALSQRKKINQFFARMQNDQYAAQERAAARDQAQAEQQAQAAALAQQQAQAAAAAAAAQQQQQQAQAAVAPQPQKAVAKKAVQKTQATAKAAAAAPAAAPAATTKRTPKKFGRQLSAEDW